MKRVSSSCRVPTAPILICGLIALAPPAAADWMGEYYPITYGATWNYENQDFPYDTWTESVFDIIEYTGGFPTVRFGENQDNHVIIRNDGQIITVFGEMDEGFFIDFDEDVVLGELVDGGLFSPCYMSECDTNMIRIWDNLDPSLRTIYGIDPGLTDLILMASYDSNYDPNLHNVVVESNLPGGVTPPSGAVTSLEWVQKGTGMVVSRDIDAESGGLVDHYVLVQYSVSVEERPDRPAVPFLGQNAPNPFTPQTSIRFSLPERGRAEVAIFDVGGRVVARLVDEVLSPGDHSLDWRGLDLDGNPVPAGTYFYRLSTPWGMETKKLVLVR